MSGAVGDFAVPVMADAAEASLQPVSAVGLERLGKAGTVRSAVYWTVRLQPGGMRRRDLVEALVDRPTATVDSAITTLQRDGLLLRDAATGLLVLGSGHAAEPGDFERLSAVAAGLLEDIADCGEAGVSVVVLARSFGLAQAEVHAALMPALSAGAIARRNLNRSHDGGVGYCMRDDVDAAADQPVDDGADAATPAGDELDFQVAFELLPDKRFRIRWADTLQVTLPREVTRAMFSFLDDLGGLRLTQRLDDCGDRP